MLLRLKPFKLNSNLIKELLKINGTGMFVLLAACMSLGGLGPAIYYNGQCGRTDTFVVEGTVINLKKIDQTSIGQACLDWNWVVQLHSINLPVPGNAQ